MGRRKRLILVVGVTLLLCVGGPAVRPAQPAPVAPMGPLTVHRTNPRYFADGTGKAVYLTGSHTHTNFMDGGPTHTRSAFNYTGYLTFLTTHGHNFIRLWTWELFLWAESDGKVSYREPLPWMRPGPGVALDGKPKFDLGRFNDAYFARLRERVLAARHRNIYVSVMLFEGWGLQFAQPPTGATGHPFHSRNNINGIDGDIDGDGKMLEIHTMLAEPRLSAIRRVQEAYVMKVIDTLNDLDNVLYEITNESGPYSTTWQYHMIEYIKRYERSKPQQHPVGMTVQFKGGRNAALFTSPADWISPDRIAPRPYNYRSDPPPNDGRKVIILDTDHFGDVTLEWVWKSFLRGHNPIFMDLAPPLSTWPAMSDQELIRRALGHTLAYARKMNLAALTPRLDVSTTRYALANPGAEYLVFAPGGGPFSVRLPAGRYRNEWFNPTTGAVVSTGSITASGAGTRFSAPFSGHAVLYLRRQAR